MIFRSLIMMSICLLLLVCNFINYGWLFDCLDEKNYVFTRKI